MKNNLDFIKKTNILEKNGYIYNPLSSVNGKIIGSFNGRKSKKEFNNCLECQKYNVEKMFNLIYKK